MFPAETRKEQELMSPLGFVNHLMKEREKSGKSQYEVTQIQYKGVLGMKHKYTCITKAQTVGNKFIHSFYRWVPEEFV